MTNNYKMKPTNKTYMSNLEKIKAAWAIGYAARIFHEINGTVMGFGINTIYIRYDDGIALQGIIREIGLEDKYGIAYIADLEITSYLYGGQLCGNEPVPVGQAFKFKGDDVDYYYCNEPQTGFTLELDYPNGDCAGEFDRDEIEPVFD